LTSDATFGTDNLTAFIAASAVQAARQWKSLKTKGFWLPAGIAGNRNPAGFAALAGPERLDCADPLPTYKKRKSPRAKEQERAAQGLASVMLNSLDIEGRPQDTRVVVAMSGGVDSSVTAALLAAEGYDVVGVTLQLYDHGAATHRKGACCAGRDIHDARAVAERIGIPHYVLDYESRFKEAVIDRFAESYASGETPVPCIDCNQAIKFNDLLKTARDLGARIMATGHYVASRALASGGRALYRAREEDRDQSYFLFATTREQLDVLRFPLGDRTKAETRELARRFGLPVADKHDSQDICFVPSGRYTDIVERLKPEAAGEGDIVDLSGKVLGRHHGIIHFTVGQRRGLGIATGAPLYVVRLDAESRRVIVGPREALQTRRIDLRDVNFIGDRAMEEALAAGERQDVFVKVRSTRAPQAAWLSLGPDGFEVELIAGEDGVSPGQACVFYDGPAGQARVLGGGIIRNAVPMHAMPDLRAARAPVAAQG
jgi:tRNA-specific 2-thiouridylase